jgi:carbonic anhydrase
MNRIPPSFIPLKSCPFPPAKTIKNYLLASALALSAALLACSNSSTTAPPALVSSTTGKAEQSAITPDQALANLKSGNHRFTTGTSLHRDYPAQVKATAAGQYPFAAVLSCMDSRTSPELVFDQGLGDLFVVRIAGNYAQADIIGSLEYATKVAGAKLIVVMGHTECGAIKGACDNVQMGNLTTVIQALQPAVNDVQGFPDDRTSKNKKFVRLVTEANVRRTVVKLRTASPILADLERSGDIKIIGAINDISTGQVTFLDEIKNPTE